MKIKIDTENSEAPEGFDFTGEYRKPKKGEWYFADPKPIMASFDFTNAPYPILSKKEPKLRIFEDGDEYFTCKGLVEIDELTSYGCGNGGLHRWRKREHAQEFADKCKELAKELHEKFGDYET